MMLDKSQIKDWEGEPETQAKEPAAAPSRKNIVDAVFEGREAAPTGETVKLTPQQTHARKRRGQWIALALFAFVILVFLLTITKMGANILVRDL